jgi:hypothetical protein
VIDFLILSLFFELQIFRDNIFFLGIASFAGEARYFLFRQKVTKNHSQSNALCSLNKQTALQMRSPTTLIVRLLQGPSLAPVACAGKTWLT